MPNYLTQYTSAAMTNRRRCAWCSPDPLYRAYHDTEWGVPLHDERVLFELLTLHLPESRRSCSAICEGRK
jgi:DNA-3-methyladenine glycosylase I